MDREREREIDKLFINLEKSTKISVFLASLEKTQNVQIFWVCIHPPMMPVGLIYILILSLHGQRSSNTLCFSLCPLHGVPFWCLYVCCRFETHKSLFGGSLSYSIFYSSPVPGTVPPARNREELKKEATLKSTNVWFQRNLSLCFSFISKC